MQNLYISYIIVFAHENQDLFQAEMGAESTSALEYYIQTLQTLHGHNIPILEYLCTKPRS